MAFCSKIYLVSPHTKDTNHFYPKIADPKDSDLEIKARAVVAISIDSDRSPSFSFGLAFSVTRLGDLLHFGQLLKACGNNYFGQN